jgi:hypothetical protein
MIISSLDWADVAGRRRAAVVIALRTDIAVMLNITEADILYMNLFQPGTLLSTGVACSFEIAAGASATRTPVELAQALKETLSNGIGQFSNAEATVGKTITASVESFTIVSADITSNERKTNPKAASNRSAGGTDRNNTGTAAKTGAGQIELRDMLVGLIIVLTLIAIVAIVYAVRARSSKLRSASDSVTNEELEDMDSVPAVIVQARLSTSNEPVCLDFSANSPVTALPTPTTKETFSVEI